MSSRLNENLNPNYIRVGQLVERFVDSQRGIVTWSSREDDLVEIEFFDGSRDTVWSGKYEAQQKVRVIPDPLRLNDVWRYNWFSGIGDTKANLGDT
jgi:hypothetical protein